MLVPRVTMKYKAVIFDMDGLLLDSERLALRLFEQACSAQGYKPDINIYKRCIGSNNAATKDILINSYGKNFPYETINQQWEYLYELETQNSTIPLKKGAKELLQWLRYKQIPTAIATSTTRSLAETKLRNTNIIDYFDFLTTRDQVKNGKPAPDIYHLAMSLVGKCRQLSPAQYLVLEDSNVGVRAGLAAGANVFQVPDIIPADKLFRNHNRYRLFNSLTTITDFLR